MTGGLPGGRPPSLLVVSPHCDDAVFACGVLLASSPGSLVVTLFAGSPPSYEPFTEWDRASGFVPGQDVMRLRREEDRLALRAVRAAPLWLDFLDAQYGRSPAVEEVALALHRVLDERRPHTIAFPLGLYHSDHLLAHAASLALVPRFDAVRWLLYEDVFYRRIPGAVQAREAALARLGYELRPAAMPLSAEAARMKEEAVRCYPSQIDALATPGRPGRQDVRAPERLRELHRIPAHAS
jgi:LmbE family N-acetylglucosaminyl deacetylase